MSERFARAFCVHSVNDHICLFDSIHYLSQQALYPIG